VRLDLAWITLARGQPVAKKEVLYRRIAQRLGEDDGVSHGTALSGPLEVGREGLWFGEGVALYAVTDRVVTGW
jgi:hypothetical protein